MKTATTKTMTTFNRTQPKFNIEPIHLNAASELGWCFVGFFRCFCFFRAVVPSLLLCSSTGTALFSSFSEPSLRHLVSVFYSFSANSNLFENKLFVFMLLLLVVVIVIIISINVVVVTFSVWVVAFGGVFVVVVCFFSVLKVLRV